MALAFHPLEQKEVREEKMKKALVLSSIFLLMTGRVGNVFAGEFKAGLYASYCALTDSIYREIYGDGGVAFGGSLSYDVLKKFELRAEFHSFQKTGKMTLTQEDVILTLTPIILGMRFRILGQKVSPYIGAGLGTLLYKEKLPGRLEQVSERATSLHFEGGSYVNLKPRLLLDLNIRYSRAPTQPFSEKIQLGGLRAGIGIGYSF